MVVQSSMNTPMEALSQSTNAITAARLLASLLKFMYSMYSMYSMYVCM